MRPRLSPTISASSENEKTPARARESIKIRFQSRSGLHGARGIPRPVSRRRHFRSSSEPEKTLSLRTACLLLPRLSEWSPQPRAPKVPDASTRGPRQLLDSSTARLESCNKLSEGPVYNVSVGPEPDGRLSRRMSRLPRLCWNAQDRPAIRWGPPTEALSSTEAGTTRKFTSGLHHLHRVTGQGDPSIADRESGTRAPVRPSCTALAF